MWKQNDPIPRFEAYLIQEGLLTQQQAETIASEASQLIEEAVAFAESSPDPRVEEITEGVYA
jgi:pyruvate dehydrogenase E1 component alpha subunit